MKRLGAICLVLVALLAPAIAEAKPSKFAATITRTKYGVPHIKAKTWQGLGFGYAYAFAQDNICTIADSYVTVARRALALLRPRRDLEVLGQRRRQQQPRLRLLLRADQRARGSSRT